MATTGKNYIIKKLSDIKGVPCPCGVSYRPITREDTALVNIHITHIKNARKHYHLKCTEFYYILKGEGVMTLDNEHFQIERDMVIMIKPKTRHASNEDFRALIVGVPPLEEDDEYFD